MIATDPQLPQSISRRQFFKGASALAGGAVVAGGIFETAQLLIGSGPDLGPVLPSFSVRADGPVRAFHTRPDLRPPTIKAGSGVDAEEGYLFLGPWGGKDQGGDQPGPLMIDQQAEPIWFNPVTSDQEVTHQWGTNFRTWTYRNQPVLAWWQGYVAPGGFGQGDGYLVDSSYQEVARVRAANGHQIDLHEFSVTPEGTALFTCFPEIVDADLSSVGGPSNGKLRNPVFQEVDIRTGKLLLEWRGVDHVPLTDSYLPVSEPFDYLHINSVKVAPDGNLIVSARHTWSIYKVNRKTGEIMWRLGGKRSDFDMGKGAQFAWQHDAQQPVQSTISVFDNGSDGSINTETRSRGVVLGVDEVGRKVKVAQEYLHPTPFLAVAMGSVQILPNSNVLVGWGTEPYLSDFSQDGKVLADTQMLSGYKSYRAFRLPWRGIPRDAPAATVRQDARTGKVTLYASWNGATDVAAHWQVHAGPSPSAMKPIGVARRRGFETAIPLGRTGGHFSLTALDEDGSRLGTSKVISV
jgi:hypothetical protein